MTPVDHFAIRYHGSKFRIADWIMSFFPQHEKYVEPFGGGGGVLLQKPRSKIEVYNDIDKRVVNFFSVLRDPAQREKLIELIELTPFARDEFNLSYEESADPIESARRLAVRAYMGFGSCGATRKSKVGFRSEVRGWMKYPDSIRVAGERLNGVLIENSDAVNIINNHDSRGTLFYSDPPYMMETRVPGSEYIHEMTYSEHEKLLETLKGVSGMVILSGYDTEMYRDNLRDWAMFSKMTICDASKGSAWRKEVVWLNPQCNAAKKQKVLFGE